MSTGDKKVRLDALLVERGFAESIANAGAIIMSGSVFIDGARARSAGQSISPYASIEVRGKQDFVSRGGIKLKKALDFFSISPAGKVCIDCGASTGGFTDCLLQAGAQMVYAVDVGYGQLAWSIRSDPRVVAMERTNIRFVKPEMFKFSPELAAIDVSFISLALVLPVVRQILPGNGEALCLVKPQFEAERGSVGSKGVVRDRAAHISVLEKFIADAAQSGYAVKGLTYSPVMGPEGNIEYLGWLKCSGESAPVDISAVVSESYASHMPHKE